MTEVRHRLTGPRAAVMLMRDIAEISEKNPKLNYPTVSFSGYEGDYVRFYAFGYGGQYDYSIPLAEREAAKLLEIEQKFDAVTGFFDSLDWAANDPSSDEGLDKNYFILRALHPSGAVIEIMANRSDVGEEVQDLESGPQVSEIGGGYMQAVTTKVVTWKPNIRLKALATEGYALPPAGQLAAIEA